MIVLTFHGLGPSERELHPGEDRLWLLIDHFEALLDIAFAHVNLNELSITFDDGNRSDLTIALPALRRRGLTARFFVLSGKLDKPGYLSRADLQQLADAGMTIGSHGADHIDWRRVPDEVLDRELKEARETIAEVIGRRVDEVAIPFGSYDRRVVQHLRREGYQAVYSSDDIPVHADDWFRPRKTITTDMSAKALQAALVRTQSGGVRTIDRAKIVLKQLRPAPSHSFLP